MGEIFSKSPQQPSFQLKSFKTEVRRPSAIPSPLPPEELEPMFEAFLEDLNLPDEKKAIMKQFSDSRKWEIMKQQFHNEKQHEVEDPESTIAEEMAQLENAPTKELLGSLSVSLRSKPIHWISKFVELKGITLLLNYLQEMDATAKEEGHEELCIKCLKSLMNNSYGLSAVFANQESIKAITMALKSSRIKTVTMVLEILSAVCFIPSGHERIMEAIDELAKETFTRRRFSSIVNLLSRDDASYDRIVNLQIACMSFINSVLACGPSKEMANRIHLRFEFIDCDIDLALNTLLKTTNPVLLRQIEIYNDKAAFDSNTLAGKYDKNKINLEDPMEMFTFLNNTLGTTSSKPYLISALRHAILVPTHIIKRPYYWKLISKTIEQIVLQKDLQDFPDFQIDVSKVVDNWVNEAKVEEHQKREEMAEKKAKKAQEEIEACHKDLSSKIDKINKDVTSLQQSQLELKRKIATLEIEKGKLDFLLKARFENPKEADKILTALHEEAVKAALEKLPEDIVQLSILPPLPPLGSAFAAEFSASVSNPYGYSGPPPSETGHGVGGIEGGGSPPPPPPGIDDPPGMGGPPPPPPPPPPGMGGPPPPPPPPGVGGPPPPPPPPGMGGPPPPPPPGGFSAGPIGPPEKPKKISKGNLKPLNWTKLKNHQIADTFWKDLDDTKFLQRLGAEKDELEQLFSTAPPPEATSSGTTESSVSNVIIVVDPRRSQNCLILLKNLGMTPVEIKKAILKMDEFIISRSVLEQLVKYVPTEEEIKQISEHKDEKNKLGPCERFFLEISTLKRYGTRLDCMFFKSSFNEKSSDIEAGISSVFKAIESIKTCKQFKQFLELLLAVGNYLNSGFRGGAYGFKLDALLKISETKSSSTVQEHHLGHYIVDIVHKKFPNLLEFKKELESTIRASKVNLPAMKTEIGQMSKGVATLKKELEVYERERDKETNKDDDFEKIMRPFFGKSEGLSKEFTMNMAKLEKDFSELVEIYGEDPKSSTAEDFFGIFAQFLENWISWEKQIELWKQLEEAEKKKKKLALEQMKKQSHKEEIFHKDGQFDEIISAVRTGEAFAPGYVDKNDKNDKKDKKKEKQKEKEKPKSKELQNSQNSSSESSHKDSKKKASSKKDDKKAGKKDDKKKKRPSALDRSD